MNASIITNSMASMYLPPECPLNSLSCMKAVDFSRQSIIYACMSTNCTNTPLVSLFNNIAILCD
uniref:Ovule protein n=1 Tax=Meloidogyne hapla TaxID=6305 RepID=A0A1I8BZT6_MELHA